MADYETYRGYPVGKEIVPKNGWQKEVYDQGMRFFEPIPPAPRPLRDGKGDFVMDEEGGIMTWTAELAAEYATRSVRAEAEAAATPEETAARTEAYAGEVAVAEVVQLCSAA
jgi:hypothetical protein